jgi:hypothetical protein
MIRAQEPGESEARHSPTAGGRCTRRLQTSRAAPAGAFPTSLPAYLVSPIWWAWAFFRYDPLFVYLYTW